MYPRQGTADMKDGNPRLRGELEIMPAIVDEQKVLVVRDHLGLIENPIGLPMDAGFLLQMLDGSHSREDIQTVIASQPGGQDVTLEAVDGLLRQLDELTMLDTEHFRERREKLVQAFTTARIRHPALVGTSYPSDAAELLEHLEAIIDDAPKTESQPADRISAVVAPHIDIDVGARGYACAYSAIRETKPDTVVIMGTGHSMDQGIFCLTTKDFRTPLGTARTDKAVVTKLIESGGDSVSPNDFPHKREHSIEIQLVFLQAALDGHDFQIVPVLCGSFASCLGDNVLASEVDGVSGVLQCLRELQDEAGKRVLYVAGVDFSHIGPKFGHEQQASLLETDAMTHDHALLRSLCEGDSKGFWAESRRVNDRFNVCGFAAMACLSEILPENAKGHFLHYDMWHEDATRSAVSYAAAVFARE